MRRVLIVDNDPESVELLSKLLLEDGNTLKTAEDADAALHRLRAWKPHLVIMDVKLSHLNGIDLIPKIRMATQEEYTSIMLVTDDSELVEVTKGLEAGADDYVLRPLRIKDLSSRVRIMFKLKEMQDTLKRANHRIEELNSTDDLTGLMSMKALYRKGDEEIARSKRFRKPVSAILLNLDRFSSINQVHGFVAGSHILQEVAVRLKQCLRSIDLIARVGADEFFIFMGETDLASAEFMAERVRDAIQSSPFRSEQNMIKLTATLGVAGLTDEQVNQRMSDLLHIATEALRSAKANGSNRIEVYSFA